MSLRIVGLALASLAASLACGARSGAPPQTPSASAEPAPDAGLPPPPRSTKKGVIVPSDLGLGAGSSGATPNSMTSSPESPPIGGPPSIGH